MSWAASVFGTKASLHTNAQDFPTPAGVTAATPPAAAAAAVSAATAASSSTPSSSRSADTPAIEWDVSKWLSQWRRATAPKSLDRGMIRSLRVAVWQSCVVVVRAGAYLSNETSVRVALNDAGQYAALEAGTVFHRNAGAIPIPAEQRGRFRTVVKVESGDCLEAAQRMLQQNMAESASAAVAGGSAPPVNPLPAVLNMASRRTPGGGVDGGAGAQEENLFRRTTLHRSLFQFVPWGREYGVAASSNPRERYPLPHAEAGIYSPATAVFRSSEATGYALLDRPFSVAFLTVAATNQGKGITHLSPPQQTDMTARIRAILRIAAAHGHTDLVLSAFGCGAFGNPPGDVANLFRRVLAEETEFVGVFRRVVFAIFDDHNARQKHNPEGNLAPFQRVFATPLPTNAAAAAAPASAAATASAPATAAA